VKPAGGSRADGSVVVASAYHRAVKRLLLLFLVSCGSSAVATTTVVIPVAPPPVVKPEVAVADPSPELVNTIVLADAEYSEHSNPKPFLALFDDDATIEVGRVERPGARDVHFGKKRLAVVYEWAAASGQIRTFRHEGERGRFDGDKVTVQLKTFESVKGTSPIAFGQRFDLMERDGAWKIIRFRYWPLYPDSGREFGEPYFEDLDAKIAADLAADNRREAAYRMMISYRFDECAVLIRRITSEAPDDPWGWDLRSTASAMTGDAADAAASRATAKRLRGGS
jgi:hypothetical protein